MQNDSNRWISHLVGWLCHSGKWGTLRKDQIGDGGVENVVMLHKVRGIVSFVDVPQLQTVADA